MKRSDIMIISDYPKPAPCKGCTDRCADCHAHCTLYTAWNEEKAAFLAEHDKKAAGARAAKDILIQGALRTIKKNNAAKLRRNPRYR